MSTINWSVTILCVTFVFLPVALSISKENDIKVIVDLLQSFDRPSNVIANVCWEKSIKQQLMIDLAKSEKPKSIKFLNVVKDKDLINAEKLIVLVDIACEGVEDFLKEANFSKYFGRPYRWFIFNRPNVEVDIPSEIEELNILPDSEVYVAQLVNNIYTINCVYKIKLTQEWIIEEYGEWSVDKGLNVTKNFRELVTAMRRRNLARIPIVTSIVVSDNDSLADMEPLLQKEKDSSSKGGYHSLTPLYEFTNSTRVLIPTDTWGYKVNGNWSGMMGHLAQELAELPGSVMFVNKERMELLDYLSNPMATSVKFIFREPPLSYQNNLYLLPFTASLWYCMGALVVVLVVAMFFIAHWEARKAKVNEDDYDGTVLIPNLSNVSVFVLSAISQQGSSVELKGSLGRFVIFVVFLVFLFIYTAYSASIVVLLQSSSNQIRTLSDLLNSKLELGVEDTPYNRFLFQNAKDPVRKAIYEKKVAPSGSKPKYFELVDGIRQLQTKPFAFNCNLGSAYKVIERYFYEHEKCGLQEISYIQNNNPMQACRKGSPYREIFKIGLLRNSEHGLDDRVNRIMFSKRPVCSVHGGSFVSVSLVDCYPVLLLLLYGMILSVVFLLAEVLHHRKHSEHTMLRNLRRP